MALITMEDIEKFSPVFQGDKGNKLANRLLHWTGVDQLAERYGRHEDLTGPEFIDAFLKDLDVNYAIGGLEHLKSLAEGPFITISNHPYGGLDGLILIDLIGHFRSDFKVMANQFLSLVKTIKDNFITVIPNTKDAAKATKESIAGVRKAISQLHEGHPLGLFPAGAVSDLKGFKICDREWQESAIRLIQKMKVPVLPVRFFDRNSSFFYFLGIINWKIRTLRLPKEVLNKIGKPIRVGLGPVITAEDQQQFNSQEALAKFLRASVYDMEWSERFIKRNEIKFDL